METKLELPSMREKRLEQMRQNISKVTGEVKVDTVIKAKLSIFSLWNGRLVSDSHSTDWKEGGYTTKPCFRFNDSRWGGQPVAQLQHQRGIYREATVLLPKYVNNNRAWLRQVILGKIGTDAISSIYNPVVGLRLTNTPTTYRRSFGTYNLSDYTNPN